MIIIMKPNASEEAIEKVKHLIESKGLQAHLSKGDEVTIVGDGKQIKTSDVYIASSREPIGGEYQALLNPQLVDRG